MQGFVSELIDTSQLEQCGLVSYSNRSFRCDRSFTTSDIEAPLSTSYRPISNAMARLSSYPVAGRTNISAGIDNGITVLTSVRSRPYAFRTMVLMTDGRHNKGPEPIISARRAALQKIIIHTVTFSSEEDFTRMRAVADATGGQHYHAPTAAELERIFRVIAATLPVLLTE
ncbi:MAG: vWA domain-containing protein [Pirellulales bacterium]